MKYLKLAELYKKLSSTTKRLEKTHYLSEFLKEVADEDLEAVILLSQGRVFPAWDDRKLGIAARLVLKALSKSVGIPIDKIEQDWKKTGDIGDSAENLIKKKKQATLFSKSLTLKKVYENLRKLTEIEGAGSVNRKTALISELLTSAKPLEARYLIRTILGDMRVGLGEGSVRDAITWAYFGKEMNIKYDSKKNNIIIPDDNREMYNKYINAIQKAYDVANDFAIVAKIAKQHGLLGLSHIRMKPGQPIKVMLAIKVNNVEEGFKRVGKPLAAEEKYDGFRIQAHKTKKEEIKLFTRRLENVTKQFPEIVKALKDHVKGDSYILDCEAVGYDVKSKKYLPFQKVSQRIKRKHNIIEMAKKFPVELNIFDCLYYNGENIIKKAFSERRKVLKTALKKAVKQKIKLAEQIITDDEKKIKNFFDKALKDGNEGLMLKNLDAPYKPGSRVGHMVKLKSSMELLDLVIVGAEYGEGKRSKWLASFTLACLDISNGEYLEIGKVGTGVKEKDEEGLSFNQLTKLLNPLITSEKGRGVKVKPKIVVEIDYEEIQKSPTYGSGYALRFPRIKRLRNDKAVDEIARIEEIKDLYDGQRGQ